MSHDTVGEEDRDGLKDAQSERAPGPAYRFGIVLALLFITFVFMATGATGTWVPFVAVILQGATLLAAFSASGVSQRLWRCAQIVVIVGIVIAVGVWITGIEAGAGILFILNALLIAGAPIVIILSLTRRQIIDIKTVMGALCVYILLGMLWASMFGAIAELQSGPFFAQQQHANIADYLYFSFVTLTTTGYGDLSAASGIGRPVAVVEALLGQLYLVTVVAVLVSRMVHMEPRARRPTQ